MRGIIAVSYRVYLVYMIYDVTLSVSCYRTPQAIYLFIYSYIFAMCICSVACLIQGNITSQLVRLFLHDQLRILNQDLK